jgi:uncharacterized protein YoxC
MSARSPVQLSPDERLALVAELEQREAGAMRRATRGAWISLLVVAVLMTTLVFVAWLVLRGLRSEVASLTQQKVALDESTRTQKAQLDQLDRDIRDKRAALSTLIGAVRTDPQALSGVGNALDKNPAAVTLVPRAYVQILDEGDRQWAKNLSDRLQNSGVLPVGIEYVKDARPQSGFDVRYYKKAEEDGAKRIVRIMQEAGVTAELKYLNLENNTRVRANHFEIWCPPNARANKLRPLVQPPS